MYDFSERDPDEPTRVVKADFLKAVPKRLIRLLYIVNRINDCFKMGKTLGRLRT